MGTIKFSNGDEKKDFPKECTNGSYYRRGKVKRSYRGFYSILWSDKESAMEAKQNETLRALYMHSNKIEDPYVIDAIMDTYLNNVVFDTLTLGDSVHKETEK